MSNQGHQKPPILKKTRLQDDLTRLQDDLTRLQESRSEGHTGLRHTMMSILISKYISFLVKNVLFQCKLNLHLRNIWFYKCHRRFSFVVEDLVVLHFNLK